MENSQNIKGNSNKVKLDFDYIAKDLKSEFYKIADYLLNNVVIKVNENRFRITELEIYYNDSENHDDPFVHKNSLQLENAKWYFHGSGLDITFGKEKIYASALIRGVKNIKSNIYTDGPLNVVTELFKSMKSVYEQSTFILSPYSFEKEEWEPVKSTRIGLNKDKDNEGDYIKKLYRYLVEINTNHKFKEKTIVAKKLQDRNDFSHNEIKKIFNRKSVNK
ncbi:MAG: hypothetical protein DSY76_08245 [Bacteroidetes bacterium]|nr:MAG: hypothetical protein DSY76_08245 [Bacteroidota bacterium]